MRERERERERERKKESMSRGRENSDFDLCDPQTTTIYPSVEKDGDKARRAHCIFFNCEIKVKLMQSHREKSREVGRQTGQSDIHS